MQKKISIKAARVNAGMTRKEVAKRLGKTEEDVVAWESRSALITDTDLTILSELYDMPVRYLRQ